MLEQDKVERIKSKDVYFLFLFLLTIFCLCLWFYLYFAVCVSFLVKKILKTSLKFAQQSKLEAIM